MSPQINQPPRSSTLGFIVRPSEWEQSHAVAIFAGQAYEAENHALPDTPMWRMLESRHDLNPARFDHWHPNVGLILEHGFQPHPDHRTPHNWTGYMRGPASPGLPLIPLGPNETPHVVCQTEPPHMGRQVAPEPAASTMLAMALAFAGGWWFFTKKRAK